MQIMSTDKVFVNKTTLGPGPNDMPQPSGKSVEVDTKVHATQRDIKIIHI